MGHVGAWTNATSLRDLGERRNQKEIAGVYKMSNYARPLPSHLRNQSLGGSQQQSPVLLARIAEKKAELSNLKDLQALSGGLADQMQMLADKLSTLADGTEGMFKTCSFQFGYTITPPLSQYTVVTSHLTDVFSS